VRFGTLFASCVAIACAACSLDESGNLVSFDGAIEASAPDAFAPDVVEEPGPPAPCSVAPGACIGALPTGWNVVAFDPNAEAACPSNFIEATEIYDATPDPNDCSCSCNVTSDPICNVGAMQRYVSSDASCNMSGVILTMTGSGCTSWPPSTSLDAYSKSSPLAPLGGSCAPSTITSSNAVASKVGRMCTPPSACAEQLCEGSVPSGLSLCVVADGVQNLCPGGFGPTPLVVGDSATVSCSGCACDMSASTCTNASLQIFGDLLCKTSLGTITVDGNCDADPLAGDTAVAFEYSATVNAQCASTSSGVTSSASLQNPKTICCKP